MFFALPKRNQEFIRRMLGRGRFKTPSEVMKEALRRMEREEDFYHLGLAALAAENAKRTKTTHRPEAGEVAKAPTALRSVAQAKRKSERRSRARKLRPDK
jgi:putative addiction module CopG family antidote